MKINQTTDVVQLARIATSRLEQYARRSYALGVLLKNADITHDEFFAAKKVMRDLIERTAGGSR